MFLEALHRTLLTQLVRTCQPSNTQPPAQQPADAEHPRQSTIDTTRTALHTSERQWLMTYVPLSVHSCVVSSVSLVHAALSLALTLQAGGDLTSRRLVLLSTDCDSNGYARHFSAIKGKVQQLRAMGVSTEAVFLSSRSGMPYEVRVIQAATAHQ